MRTHGAAGFALGALAFLTLDARAESLSPEASAPIEALPPAPHDAPPSGTTAASEASPSQTPATELPRAAYTHTAFGSASGVIGAAGFGEGVGGTERGDRTELRGGLRIFGSPFDRLTLFADAERTEDARFAPSASAQVRLLGNRSRHYAVALLGRYKADGFAELAGEGELGLLTSYAAKGLHLDLNAVFGAGFEENEKDGEALARFGFDVTDYLRVGGEGRARKRLGGSASLPGNRDWDAFAGPQALAYHDHYFFGLTAGPSNVGVAGDLGWIAIATAGGVAF